MYLQSRDSIHIQPFVDSAPSRRARRSYRIEIPAATLDAQCMQIEQVIQFALDQLGAHHLEVRVIGIEQRAET